MSRLPTLADVDRDWISRRGLAEFVRRAWPLVEPRPLVWGRHLDVLCALLEAQARHELRDLVINVPPATGKSLLCSVLYPAWRWTFDPSWRAICVSYASTAAAPSHRDAQTTQRLVASAWYCERWPRTRPDPKTWNVSYCKTTAGGSRVSTSVGGTVTGQHGDLLFDDPVKPDDAANPAAMEEFQGWYERTMPTRRQKGGSGTLVMQRLGEADPSGYLEKKGWTVFALPMRFEPARAAKCPWACDWRTREGELLWPEMFADGDVATLERELGPSNTAGQLQQRPSPEAGAVIRREWIRRWTPADLPPLGELQLVQSWDMAFKDSTQSDWVVGEVWGARGTKRWLLDQVRGRWGFDDTCRAVLRLSAKWPAAQTRLVEDKANGPAVMNHLKNVLRCRPVEPQGSKLARLRACEPAFAAGDVCIPAEAPWAGDYVEELVTFPFAAHDDQVDATSQALRFFDAGAAQLFRAAMARVEQPEDLLGF